MAGDILLKKRGGVSVECKQPDICNVKFDGIEKRLDRGSIRMDNLDKKSDKIIFRLNALVVGIFVLLSGIYWKIDSSSNIQQRSLENVERHLTENNKNKVSKIASIKGVSHEQTTDYNSYWRDGYYRFHD